MTTTTVRPVRRPQGSPASRGDTSIPAHPRHHRGVGRRGPRRPHAHLDGRQSIRSTRDILSDPFGIPKEFVWENYATAWTRGNFGIAALNSTLTTVVASTLTVAIAAPAAYFLARVDTPLTRGLTLYFIIGLGIPAQVILIPLFVMLAQASLTDSCSDSTSSTSARRCRSRCSCWSRSSAASPRRWKRRPPSTAPAPCSR